MPISELGFNDLGGYYYNDCQDFTSDSWDSLANNPTFEQIMKAALARTEHLYQYPLTVPKAHVVEDDSVTEVSNEVLSDPIKEKGFMGRIMEILASIGDFFRELGKLFYHVS